MVVKRIDVLCPSTIEINCAVGDRIRLVPGVNTPAMPMVPPFWRGACADIAAGQVVVIESSYGLRSTAVVIDRIIGDDVSAARKGGKWTECPGDADGATIHQSNAVDATSGRRRQVEIIERGYCLRTCAVEVDRAAGDGAMAPAVPGVKVPATKIVPVPANVLLKLLKVRWPYCAAITACPSLL